jgi:hypothetical protein
VRERERKRKKGRKEERKKEKKESYIKAINIRFPICHHKKTSMAMVVRCSTNKGLIKRRSIFLVRKIDHFIRLIGHFR